MTAHSVPYAGIATRSANGHRCGLGGQLAQRGVSGGFELGGERLDRQIVAEAVQHSEDEEVAADEHVTCQPVALFPEHRGDACWL